MDFMPSTPISCSIRTVGEVGVEFIDDGGAALPTIPDCFAQSTKIGLNADIIKQDEVEHVLYADRSCR
jgi:hypothetical protein